MDWWENKHERIYTEESSRWVTTPINVDTYTQNNDNPMRSDDRQEKFDDKL